MIGPEFPHEAPTRVPERTIRQFAALCLAIGGGLFALSCYRHGHAPGVRGWIAAALVVLIGLPGLIRPNAIRPIYLVAIALTKPIGHVVGLVLLAIVYYGVLTPLAVAFRLAGRDGLGRHRQSTGSYWIDRVRSSDVLLYLRQYQRQIARDLPSSVGAPAAVAQQFVAPPIVAEFSSTPSPAIPGAHHGPA